MLVRFSVCDCLIMFRFLIFYNAKLDCVVVFRCQTVSNISVSPPLGSSQTLHGEIVTVYSKLLSTETIECSCVDFSCDSVYWFHMAPEKTNVKFVGKCNNADRVTFGNVEKARFKISKRGSMSFMLRIINVTLEDTGIYSCVLKNKSNSDMWRPGVLLLPGGLYAEMLLFFKCS